MKQLLDDVSYYYEDIGNKADTVPLMLLHGFTGDGTTWSALCHRLKTKKRLIVPHIIGHGKTASPSNGTTFKMERVAKHLVQLLNVLHIEKIDILGYSMGGRLALTFAVKYPERVRKLILESASPGLKTEAERLERRQKDEQLAQFILEKGIPAFVDYWEAIPLFQTQRSLPEVVQYEIRQQRMQNNPVGLANSLRFMGTGAQPSHWDKLSSLSMDVLLITGEQDEKFCFIAEEMMGQIAKGQHVVVSGCGHAIHVEDAEKFGTIVSGFLSKNCEGDD